MEGSTVDSTDRPLTTLETKPAYLEVARQQLRKAGPEGITPFALLLAQHGEFDGIALLAKPGEAPSLDRRDPMSGQAMMAAIALSRDSKYVPVLRAMMENTKDEWQLRSMLRALRGMSGADVRQLRLEINRQMRKTTE
jgi:hypothetical protein